METLFARNYKETSLENTSNSVAKVRLGLIRGSITFSCALLTAFTAFAADGDGTDSENAQRCSRLIEIESDLDRIQNRYSASHPVILSLQNEIELLRTTDPASPECQRKENGSQAI